MYMYVYAGSLQFKAYMSVLGQRKGRQAGTGHPRFGNGSQSIGDGILLSTCSKQFKLCNHFQRSTQNNDDCVVIIVIQEKQAYQKQKVGNNKQSYETNPLIHFFVLDLK